MAESTPDQAVDQTERDWTTDFDHFDPAFIADPDPVWSELRERCPVAHSERYGGMNVVTRWSDVSAVAQNPATFSSYRNVVTEVPTSHRGRPLPPINNDPPLHTEQRRLMLPFFTAKATEERWAEPVREICRRALAAIEGRDRCDLAVDYAQVVPAELTAQMLGVSLDDVPQFRIWLRDHLQVGPNDTAVLRAATGEMLAYLTELLEQHKREGGDDVVTYLLDQRLDDEPLPDAMIVDTLFLLLVAGIDTTWSSIGFSLLHLAGHPEDRKRLAADPSLIPGAIEEFLRAYPPVWVARVATTDTELAGCPIAAGDWVVMGLPAANRDPELYERPDDVLIDRDRNLHAAFGLGVHRCLGSNLARMEMQIALEEWLARYPDFELADPSSVVMAGGQIRGPRSVPARLLS
jgi:cytochrome P450